MEEPAESLSFETALKELEKIVGRLESGDTPLQEAIDLSLMRICRPSFVNPSPSVSLFVVGLKCEYVTNYILELFYL